MAVLNLINLKIRDTDTILFEGIVDRISSFNEVGPFDIYPMHANFISIISKSISIYKYHKLINTFIIDKAVMKNMKDKCIIFIGIESLLVKEETEVQKEL